VTSAVWDHNVRFSRWNKILQTFVLTLLDHHGVENTRTQDPYYLNSSAGLIVCLSLEKMRRRNETAHCFSSTIDPQDSSGGG